MVNKTEPYRNKRQNKNHSEGQSRDVFDFISQLSNVALQNAENAIEDRKKLNQRFLKEIGREIKEARKMLDFLGDPWKHGDKTEYEFMRISLDKALTARKKERRERLLQEWKDLLDLHEKRIDLLKDNLALGNTETTGKNHKKMV